MNFYSKHKRGIIGTAIFHLSVLILLLWLGFFTPLPLPGEEGILVDFGNSGTGLGRNEPSPKRNIAPVEVEKKREKAKVTPPPPQKTTPPRPRPKPKPAKQEAMTQDYEKTAAIDAARGKKEEEEQKKNEALEKERKRQAEIEKVRRAELEKQRREELERQRQAELERQRREEEARKIKEINSRTKDAFKKSGSGSGGAGQGNSKSQGVTFPGGNQGSPLGSPNSNRYGTGGSGPGNRGDGPSYSLAGRNATSLPLPNYPGNEEGVVVVQVTVNKNGAVVKAVPGVRGSNTMNPELLAAARKAALQARFNPDNNAPALQQGKITYRFVLD
ncbi:Ferric siderophore transport system, periplasmic binding protein TonB [hydrothermal vent metagenome]|uniref:Ferric siderophore transport system, periplasmic binding protein TonB n=1 Tax=hydrothermal vent metagenome TaxID=652676 RepID=A0A3B0UW46_9ZZZZ